jgi:catechol 2,3-dioxygenase-like lactoylglutathione lyase family enzyme
MSESFSISGLNHIGLVVEDIEVAKTWFCTQLGLKILEDRGEIVFILAGNDIIAIKTPQMAVSKPEHGAESTSLEKSKGWQFLDHYGFYAQTAEEVDHFAAFLRKENIEILKGPYSRSDGRSVYFKDPCGNVGEYLYWSAHP